MAKSYLYKVYDSDGNYIKTWNDVVSDFDLPEELNTPGSEMRVELARSIDSLGEGDDIALDNEVKVYVVDDDAAAQNSLIQFHGYIIDYTPTYGAKDNLQVTISSFGLDLGEHMLDLGDPIIQDNFNATASSNYLAQTFTPDADIYLQSISLWLNASEIESEVTLRLVQGTASGSVYGSGTAIATKTKRITGETWQKITFVFDDQLLLSAATQYYFEGDFGIGVSPDLDIQVQYSNLGEYSGGQMFSDASGSGYVATDSDLRFSINGGTELNFGLVDPSDMLRKALDIYAASGGRITYSVSTIDDTGYTTSYDFNGMTMLEIIKKCRELAPKDWNFYIDQATNELHFHKRTTTIDHRLVLGKNIKEIKPEKTKRNVINTIYFVGGDGLYRKYTRGTGRTRAERYVDQRVTRAETADTIASALLEAKNAPEVRVSVTLIDNNGSANFGYDIESITVGENVTFRGIKNADSSLWDSAIWDSSYWDFDINNIETLVLQIVRIERSPGKATLKLTSLPQDVNKRIEDINRRLVQDQTIGVDIAAEVIPEGELMIK